MENQTVTTKAPNNVLARMQVVHLGQILFRVQFVALAIMLASIISFIIIPIYYVLLIAIAMVTLFTLFLNPVFMSFWSGGAALAQLTSVLGYSWKYTIPVVLVLSISSIVCLCFDKNKKHIGKIVGCAFICVAAIIMLIFEIVVLKDNPGLGGV